MIKIPTAIGAQALGLAFLLAGLAAAATPTGSGAARARELGSAGIRVVQRGRRIIYLIPTDLPLRPYRIGPSDLIDINVWENAQLTQTVEVGLDGEINVPLVGNVMAAGMTVPDLQRTLVADLGKFIKDPVVTVSVKDPRSHRYTVVGEVAHPGSYVIKRPLRVLDALSIAGGFQTFAKPDAVYVMRRIPGGPEVKVAFQYSKVIAGRRSYENIQLQAGDVLVVP